MPKVIHLLPYDGIGGAESAARSMKAPLASALDLQVRFLFPTVSSQRQRSRTLNPVTALRSTLAVVREAPDVLIVSLWRSCLAGLLVKMLRPRTRMVVMIHNSVDAHLADHLATRAAIGVSDEVWADSEASVRLRFKRRIRRPLVVIPFLLQHLPPLDRSPDLPRPTPDFIFWGRLAAQKNLPRALDIFKNIARRHPAARFTIIGPDSGELAGLREECARAGIAESVRFEGPMPFESIRDEARTHSFYLQTSNYEGMAMSVVEAMQMGLVPVVTPAGEIASYCHPGINSVVVRDAESATAEVLRLLADPVAWEEMRRQAIATWRDGRTYRDAVEAECLRLSGRMAG
jgi:glycosyltransferase involved in cell wall biosynthesis